MTDAQVTAAARAGADQRPAAGVRRGHRASGSQLSNLGLSQRPDLVDGHTIHWHGFVNEAPVFDGVPELSLSVPIGRSFTYFYVPHDAGTYMYHCHFEDVEHVQMGMTGPAVRPAPAEQAPFDRRWRPSRKSRLQRLSRRQSTAYDREFGF